MRPSNDHSRSLIPFAYDTAVVAVLSVVPQIQEIRVRTWLQGETGHRI